MIKKLSNFPVLSEADANNFIGHVIKFVKNGNKKSLYDKHFLSEVHNLYF